MKVFALILSIFLLTTCSTVSLKRPKVNLPPEPEYTQISIIPCEAKQGHSKAKYTVSVKTDFNSFTAYCISEEDLKSLLENIVKMDTYNKQLLELLRSIADIEESQDGN